MLNSVFLHECTQAGLDTAIVHASKILPMNKIPDEQRETALDLVYNRRSEGYDPLQKLMQLFEGVSAASARESRAEELGRLPLFERLERRIVDGERNGLDADLDAAMDEKPPLEIINETLLSGMKTVGELFGSGQMQLPFVLASAEVMKAAVAHLEPHMEATDDDGKGRIVLGTVKGDVHDIGKNLVDIILSNNGYEVVNLGIKQPISTILEAALDKRADVIGMSGLLVKSTVVMKDNLIELNNKGVAEQFPVLLGGAALTRSYVENDLQEVYQGDVHYARDAFEGLRLMDTIMTTKRGGGPAPDSPEALEAKAKAAERKARHERSRRIAEQRKATAEPVVVPERSDVATDIETPVPPFWGTRIVKGVSLAEYSGLLDERALFLGQWGLRGVRKGEGATYEDLVESEGKPRLRYWLDRLSTDGILAHAALVYGYFPAVSEGDDVVVLDQPNPDAAEKFRFTFPRQQRDRFLCIADFIRSRDAARESGQVDVLPMNLVTMGQPIADFANELFAADSYRDYLEVHGIGVQLTEALAEYWHRRVRRRRERSQGGRGLFQARISRRALLLRIRSLPGSRGPHQTRSPARTGTDRCQTVGGAPAPPRAVDRRIRAPPPGSQVLQCMRTTISSVSCSTWTAHCSTRRRSGTWQSPSSRWNWAVSSPQRCAKAHSATRCTARYARSSPTPAPTPPTALCRTAVTG